MEVPANIRRIQTIDPLSVATWTDYLVVRRDDYNLAPIVAVIDQQVVFESLLPEMPEIGRVQIPMSARLIIRDGQHRRAAIKSLLTQDATLGNDTISIMLLSDPGLVRASKLYIDLHPGQKQSTRSTRVLHGHSDLAALVRQLTNELPLFQGLIELEKTTISNRSTALFTISAVYQATQALLGVSSRNAISAEHENIAYEFWRAIGRIIPEWQQIINQATTAYYLRQHYIHSHTVTLLAIGMAGHELILAHPGDWQERLEVLATVDWSRDNKTLWEGRAMVRGKMNKSRDSINLTASAIKQFLGLTLTEREFALEQSLSGL
jgi:DNA sulfur modification protein DndB